MNQFQNLINDCLIDTKHVESAVILVAKTAAVTAASARFQVLPTQAQIFIDSFKHMTLTRERGFYFQDKAYTCVRADRNSIYCKCGTHGLILVKTALYIIVATYNDSMYPSVCVEAVEKLGRGMLVLLTAYKLQQLSTAGFKGDGLLTVYYLQIRYEGYLFYVFD
ncbi:profilin-4 [Salvelinus namaycush]|uniref:Profilin n=1 Tax=Salvelinus namaycush TaxID=8040 RepID=A0A8U0TPM9_SALNM|nr:profilin-4 [Salvelinus namaycush]